MTTSTQHPQAITLPRPTFAKLSPHPYLTAHLQPPDSSLPPCRANGRLPSQFRPPHVNTSSLTHCSGSAVLRIGDTAVVCGVRAEVLLASDVPLLKVSRADGSSGGRGADGAALRDGFAKEKSIDMKGLDLLVPNIELATGCSPQYLPGQPPSALAQSLSTRVRESLFSTGVVGEEGLGIWYQIPRIQTEGEDDDAMEDGEGPAQEEEEWEIKGFWTLYIDILFISLDGNPFDAAWAAVMAALHDVRLPRAYWDADREMILCSDEVAESRKLSLRGGLPVAVTAVVFKTKERGGSAQEKSQWVLVDPDMFEEGLCDESVTLIVACGEGVKTRILGMSKVGGRVVGKREMSDLLGLAERRWMEFAKVVTGF